MAETTTSFTYEVPAGHAEGGTKKTGEFTHVVVSDDSEAVRVLKENGWSLVNLVNAHAKSTARTNARARALAAYMPSRAEPAAVRQRMINDLIKSGLTEAAATAAIDSALATARSE